MSALDKIKAKAQADANREQVRLMILNLNTFSPLYVIRHYDERATKHHSFVAAIEPA